MKKDNSLNTISAKKSVKRTVCRQPRKTLVWHSVKPMLQTLIVTRITLAICTNIINISYVMSFYFILNEGLVLLKLASTLAYRDLVCFE